MQIVETFGDKLVPTSVERLDRIQLAEALHLDLPPVMIYGDDVSDIATEEGIANLLLCRTAYDRGQAIRGVAGYTPVGRARDRRMVEELRARKVSRRPEDLGIDPLDTHRSLLAVHSVKDLMHWSAHLYEPPVWQAVVADLVECASPGRAAHLDQ
ncbi:malonate decarboxylase subunit alpha [Inquilinus sp.]|uniref:malonate decarboxylase subunit alpha n=1 Tax=Inquilinus sp. TaxID=1932117 RepID=UPI0031E2DED8